MINTRKRRRRRKSNRHTIGKIMAIIQIVLSVVFMAVLFMINVLPMKYMAIVFGILLFLDMFSLGSQFTRSAHVIGKIDCILMCILLKIGRASCRERV